MRVGLREANQRFSALIREVRAGREVVLTERGKPVALLKPVPNDDGMEAALRRLEAEGLVRLPSRYDLLPSWKPRKIQGASLSATIRAERDAE